MTGDDCCLAAEQCLALAPMVGLSQLPFRLLCRRYGADLCWTPMFHADRFVVEGAYRRLACLSTAEDRPLASV